MSSTKGAPCGDEENPLPRQTAAALAAATAGGVCHGVAILEAIPGPSVAASHHPRPRIIGNECINSGATSMTMRSREGERHSDKRSDNAGILAEKGSLPGEDTSIRVGTYPGSPASPEEALAHQESRLPDWSGSTSSTNPPTMRNTMSSNSDLKRPQALGESADPPESANPSRVMEKFMELDYRIQEHVVDCILYLLLLNENEQRPIPAGRPLGSKKANAVRTCRQPWLSCGYIEAGRFDNHPLAKTPQGVMV